MATLSNKLGAKTCKNVQQEYLCEVCDYKCYRKFCWERHLMTSKHHEATFSNTLATETQGGYDLPNRGSRDDDKNYWHGSDPNIAPRGNPPPPPGRGPPLQRKG